MGIASVGYRLVLIAHILASIAGFGAVFFNGVYSAQGRKRGGREALVIAEANHIVSYKWAEKFILAVPLLGALLVLLSHGKWTFGQFWVWGSLLLFVASWTLAFGALKPAERRFRSVLGELVAGASGSCGDCSGGCGGSAGETEANTASNGEGAVPHGSGLGAAPHGNGLGAAPHEAGASTSGATAIATSTLEPAGPAELRQKAQVLSTLEKRLSAVGGVLHLSLLAMIVLMVFKPA